MRLYNFLRLTVLKIIIFFFPIKVFKKDRYLKNQGGLIICNHYSILDIPFVATLEKGHMHFLGKKELFEKKFGRWFFTKVGVIPVDRDTIDAKAALKAIKVLKNGKKLGVFPEGTRNKTDRELLDVKGGAGLFAIKSKTPIQPVVTLKKARIFKRTYMLVGEPFELDEFYGKKISSEDFDKIGDILKSKLLSLKQELRDIISERKRKK